MFETIADGYGFTEGPIVLEDGSIAFADTGVGIYQIASSGGKALMKKIEGSANGLALLDGSILIANNGGIGRDDKVPGSVQRLNADGELEMLAGNLDAPNDICIAGDGSIVFTDPRDNYFLENLPPGRVYRIGPDSSLEILHEGLAYPNGIGVDSSGRVVVAESKTGGLHRIQNGVAEMWATVEGAPDGFTFDAKGWCFVCSFDIGVVSVLSDKGTLEETIHVGYDTWPTNCTIAPTGNLIVTEAKQGRVLSFPLGLEAA